jgi:hypothetical protein
LLRRSDHDISRRLSGSRNRVTWHEIAAWAVNRT